MKVYSGTDIGLSRVENQDRVKTAVISTNKAALVVLCDGMGGENAGSEASELAVSVVYDRILNGYRDNYDSNSIRNLLTSAVYAANAMVYDLSGQDVTKIGMGTTCVAALVIKDGSNKTAHIINVGDSRAYFVNSDGIAQITNDHTVVRLLYEQGKITKDEIKSHPQRNYITKAVGAGYEIEPDYFEYSVIGSKSVLLCSDGLTGCCVDDDIFRVIDTFSVDETVNQLIDLAKKCNSADNITIGLIDLEHD